MDEETEIRKLRWRCRRGMRVLDQLLERWLDTQWRTATAQERVTFLQLLDTEDDRLWRWVLGHEAPEDAALRRLVERITSTTP